MYTQTLDDFSTRATPSKLLLHIHCKLAAMGADDYSTIVLCN